MVYHIISRGNNKQDIFLEDRDRRDFMELLGRATQRFNLQIFSFCLMSNHFHLFLRTREANLSRAMQWLNTTYTVRFHLRHHRSGHFFQGRYKSVVVLEEAHWQRLSFYLHLNPVRAVMIEDPLGYEWSSLRDYVRPKSRYEWLCRDEVLAAYGRGASKRRRRYRSACLALCSKPKEFWKDISEAVVIGSRELLEKLIKDHPPKGKSGEVSEFRKVSRPVLEVEDELEAVAKAFGVEEHRLREKGTHHPARQAAYYHLTENCGMKASTVAEIFGVHPSTVTRGAEAIRRKAFDDPAMEKTVAKITGRKKGGKS
jgi:REP element-mobilizing transposase RayT